MGERWEAFQAERAKAKAQVTADKAAAMKAARHLNVSRVIWAIGGYTGGTSWQGCSKGQTIEGIILEAVYYTRFIGGTPKLEKRDERKLQEIVRRLENQPGTDGKNAHGEYVRD